MQSWQKQIEGKNIKLSRTWVQRQLKDLKAVTQAVSSTEPKDVSQEDKDTYWVEKKSKMHEIGDVRCQQTFDEFNGFKDRAPGRVLIHRSETEGDRQGHVKKTSGGRISWSGGMVFGPMLKGKVNTIFL